MRFDNLAYVRAFKTDCYRCPRIEESLWVHSHHQALLNDDKKFAIVPSLSYQNDPAHPTN
jgi:hypothetical protein